jgi:hypothetical protein
MDKTLFRHGKSSGFESNLNPNARSWFPFDTKLVEEANDQQLPVGSRFSPSNSILSVEMTPKDGDLSPIQVHLEVCQGEAGFGQIPGNKFKQIPCATVPDTANQTLVQNRITQIQDNSLLQQQQQLQQKTTTTTATTTTTTTTYR